MAKHLNKVTAPVFGHSRQVDVDQGTFTGERVGIVGSGRRSDRSPDGSLVVTGFGVTNGDSAFQEQIDKQSNHLVRVQIVVMGAM